MSGRQSATVDKALRMVQRGSTAYAAAKACGIALSTIYRAQKRIALAAEEAAATEAAAKVSRIRKIKAQTS